MRNRALLITISILFIIDIFLVVICKGLFNKVEYCTLRNEILKQKDSLNIKKYQDYILRLSINNSKKINENIALIAENGQKIILKEIIKSEPKIFFKYFKESCYSCVEKEFWNMRKVFSEKDLKEIIILTNDNLKYRISFFKQENQLNNPVFIVNQDFSIPIDSMKLPYLFTLDNKGTLNNLFVPIESDDSLSIKYYKILKNKYY